MSVCESKAIEYLVEGEIITIMFLVLKKSKFEKKGILNNILEFVVNFKSAGNNYIEFIRQLTY